LDKILAPKQDKNTNSRHDHKLLEGLLRRWEKNKLPCYAQ
jgi:hypothetical protein